MKKNSLYLIISLLFCLFLLSPGGLFGEEFLDVPLQIYPEKQPFTLGEYKKQKRIVLMNFWAPWCIPCRKEFPELEALQKKFSSKKVRVVGITAETKDKKIDRFLSKYGGTFPILVDPKGDLHEKIQVAAMPTTVLLDAEGNIKKEYYGYTKAQGLGEIEKDIRALLN